VVCLLGVTILAAVVVTRNIHIPLGWGTQSVSYLFASSCAPVDYLAATTVLEDHDVTKVSEQDEKPKSNGRTEDVQWDQYSLLLKSQRVFLQCVYLLQLLEC
jgi:hypothetical protein